MWSRFLRRALIVAAAVTALFIVLVGAAHLPFVRARVLEWARGYASREFGVVVTADDLSYNLLGVSVELHNLSLSAPGQRPFLQADGLLVRLDRRLYAGSVDIQQLDLQRPRVTLVRHQDGSTNLPTTPNSPASKPTPLHLGIVSLTQFSFEADDEGAGHKAAAGPADLRLDTRAKGAPPGSFGPSAISVLIAAPGEPRTIAGTFGGGLAFDGERLAISDLHLDTPQGQLTLKGWVDVIAETIRVEAQGRLETDLAQAGRFFGKQGESLAGLASADVTVSGLVSDPVVHAVASARNLRYQSFSAANAETEATYSGGRVQIQRLAVSSDIGNASATGSLQVTSVATSSAANQLHAHITDIDLDRALASSGVRLPVRLGSTADGDIDLSLDARHPIAEDWWRQLTATGSVRLGSTGSGLALEGRLNLGVNGDRWTIEHQLESKAGPTTIAGVVSGQTNQNAAGEFASTLAGQSRVQIEAIHPLTPYLQQAGVTLPPPLDAIDGAIDAVIEPRGTFSSPRALATISGRGVRLPEFPEGQLDGTVAIDRTLAKAESLRAQMGTTSLTGDGTYAWSGQIDARFDVTADDIHAVASLAGANDVAVSGSARLVGTVQGTAQSPRARATLSAHDLSAYDVAIGSVNGELRLADNTVQVEANAPGLNATLQGSVAIAEPYRYQAQATLVRSPIASLVPPSVLEKVAAEGSITTTVKSEGTLTRPLESGGELFLRALDLKAAGVPIVLEAPATVSVQPNALTITGLAVRAGDRTHVQASGSLGVNDVRNGLSVRADGPISDLLAMAAPALPDVSIEAQESDVNLDLHIGGTLMSPQPSGTLKVTATSLRYAEQPPLTDVAVDAQIEPAQIAVQSIAAHVLGARLQGHGTLPLRMVVPKPPPAGTADSGIAAWGSRWLASLPTEPRSASVTARLTSVSTDALAAFVDPSKLQQLSGSVDATVRAEADGFSVDRIRGSLVLDAASLKVADVPFAQSVPTRVSLDQGHARIEEFRWNAETNELRVSGGADLFTPDRQVDLAVDGDLDLRILGAFVNGIASGGIAHSALTVKGPMGAPVVLGEIGVRAGELRLDTAGVVASDLQGTIVIPADRNATIALTGTVNGGDATVKGTVSLADITTPSGRVTATARNVTLDYPEGFQTESNADLVLTLAPTGSTLSGRVDVLSGLYREPLVVSRALLAGLSTQAGASTDNESSFLSTLTLDVAVTTAEQVRIDNNYGRLNIGANLQISGTASQPGAIGRIEADPDGEIYLAGNTYRVESLVVDLTNPRAIAPEVRFLADTRVGNVPIEVALQCSATGQCDKDIRSQDPGVTNTEAEAMLVGLSGDPADAGAQLARLLSGELLGIVGQTFGLDTLRLEQASDRGDLFADPTLVAGDVNPASRLTIGKRLGEHVELAYSQNLAQNGFTMTTSYFAPGGISVRALLFDDQSRTYEFRHQPRFGASHRKRPVTVSGARIAAVRFSGNPGFPDTELRRQLRVTVGDRFAFAAWQADRERLMAFYQSRGYYEVRVRARRLTSEGDPPDSASDDRPVESITLEYEIERGRATFLEISGFDVPGRIRQQIIKRWSSALFDGFLERDAALIVRQSLYDANRFQATVTTTIESRAEDDSKTLRIAVDPGRATNPQLLFEGNSAISTATLTTLAERSGPLAAWLDPASFAVMIASLYHDEGWLSAAVNLQAPRVQDDVSIIRVVIDEGEPWTLGRIGVDGAAALGDGGTIDPSGLSVDGRYSPKMVAEGIANLEQRFRDAGFLNAHLSTEHSLDQSAHRVNVHVVADPGPRTVLSFVAIDAPPADRAVVERTVKLVAGNVLTASDLSAARKRLYESGAFRSVDIELTPTDVGPAQPKAGDTTDRRVIANVRVEQRPRYTFRYGLAVNDDVTGPDQRNREIGLAADLENRNVLGLGATLGMSARVRRDQEVGRVYLGVPSAFGLPLQSTLFLSRSRQNIGSDGPVKTVADVTEVSGQQTYRLRKLVTVSYGYGLGRNRTTIQGSDFDLTVRVARLNGNAVIEHRNDPFDPSRGWFSSANFELSRPGLGSELSFLRGFFQQFQFFPIGRGVVVASAARVGLARTYRGETLIPSERFFAGGATSVRGYGDQALGARSVLGDAEGGAASLIANGEVRFPIYRWLRGVGFVDLGNVYPTVYDLFHTGMQVGAGAGFRLNTPVGLLRLDLAVPTNPRPLDPSWTWYFGLGHAF